MIELPDRLSTPTVSTLPDTHERILQPKVNKDVSYLRLGSCVNWADLL